MDTRPQGGRSGQCLRVGRFMCFPLVFPRQPSLARAAVAGGGEDLFARGVRLAPRVPPIPAARVLISATCRPTATVAISGLASARVYSSVPDWRLPRRSTSVRAVSATDQSLAVPIHGPGTRRVSPGCFAASQEQLRRYCPTIRRAAADRSRLGRAGRVGLGLCPRSDGRATAQRTQRSGPTASCLLPLLFPLDSTVRAADVASMVSAAA